MQKLLKLIPLNLLQRKVPKIGLLTLDKKIVIPSVSLAFAVLFFEPVLHFHYIFTVYLFLFVLRHACEAFLWHLYMYFEVE